MLVGIFEINVKTENYNKKQTESSALVVTYKSLHIYYSYMESFLLNLFFILRNGQ